MQETCLGLTPWLGRFPGERHGNPLQYSCLENPRDRGAWWAIVHGITKCWKERNKVKLLNHVPDFATTWILAYQAPPSMGFSRQEYWSGVPFPSPGDIPNPGIEPRSPALWFLLSEPSRKSIKVLESTEQLRTLREEMIKFTCP